MTFISILNKKNIVLTDKIRRSFSYTCIAETLCGSTRIRVGYGTLHVAIVRIARLRVRTRLTVESIVVAVRAVPVGCARARALAVETQQIIVGIAVRHVVAPAEVRRRRQTRVAASVEVVVIAA